MPSLTPQQRADDTVWEAMKEGFASGGLAMIPSSLAGEQFVLLYAFVVFTIVFLLECLCLIYYYANVLFANKVYAAMNFSPKFVKVR